jgi:DNA-binding transcriptional ArsR family regulator
VTVVGVPARPADEAVAVADVAPPADVSGEATTANDANRGKDIRGDCSATDRIANSFPADGARRVRTRVASLVHRRRFTILRYMAKSYEDPLSRTFGALTDPTRRAILSYVHAHPDCSVSELAGELPLKLPGVTKHLDVLTRARLIERRKSGRVVSVRLRTPPLRRAGAWLAQYDAFWIGSLDKLQRRLESGQ